jgi:hypothetical protein
MQKFAQKLAPGLVMLPAFLLGISITGCASIGASRHAESVPVTPADRLFLDVSPFDAVVRAELERAGLKPEQAETEFNAELRYLLALRKQEEARDSAGAMVHLRVTVRHLQPGSGNTGNFAAVTLTATRGKEVKTSEWDWRTASRENVPETYAGRHLIRALSQDVVSRLKASRRKANGSGLDYPPPLILMK